MENEANGPRVELNALHKEVKLMGLHGVDEIWALKTRLSICTHLEFTYGCWNVDIGSSLYEKLSNGGTSVITCEMERNRTSLLPQEKTKIDRSSHVQYQ